jgi:hypothetical protein
MLIHLPTILFKFRNSKKLKITVLYLNADLTDIDWGNPLTRYLFLFTFCSGDTLFFFNTFGVSTRIDKQYALDTVYFLAYEIIQDALELSWTQSEKFVMVMRHQIKSWRKRQYMIRTRGGGVIIY